MDIINKIIITKIVIIIDIIIGKHNLQLQLLQLQLLHHFAEWKESDLPQIHLYTINHLILIN